ncbi:hypothetical protein CSC70_10090 [Pseudoxanthomonas kalamensis DSM 18571]|nr:hypothetical protein CSC70_10090 [Pseudoxanthomonas kalamensis DSM 18571]
MHVNLARRLAENGFDVFRFDMPNIGDAQAGGAKVSGESTVRAAFDAIHDATGAQRFVVGGICSAADKGWRVAIADNRVEGVLLLDGMAVQGRWFRMGQMRLMLSRSPLRWPGMVLRFFRAKDENAPGLEDFRDWPEHPEFLAQLEELLSRGVRILALYTGGISYYLLHAKQLDDTFGRFRWNDGLEADFWPHVDHMFFSATHREQLMTRICRWVAEG